MEYQRLPLEENKLRQVIATKRFLRLNIAKPIWLAKVDSTQLYSANELRSSEEGDLVISRVQTSGRGRENRSWFSQSGGLWLTLTLCPPRSEILSEIPTMATTAIVKTFDKSGLPGSTIKPPNDVYYKERKIAGVLADAKVTGTSSIVYLGVGININNDPSEMPDIAKISTSFRLITGRTLDLVGFAGDFLEFLDSEYRRLISDESA